ncbi:MAG: toll/interleukin-1 receptor domain-containing protein [Chloroflexi bacterium]|nr:toll/interleukin-1 receptor domain-containing protein [Chloroflexota bacterium]
MHDFALDLILKQFDGAPATQQIPPSLRWVFVCYHAGDEEFARRLATRLERTGVFHAFFLPWQIGWGQSLRKVLDAGLEKCNAGIVVFTPEFLGDGWRDYEYSGLISKKVNEGSKVGYALLRGDHSDVPHALQDYFYADFRDPGQFEREFLKIYRGLLGRPLEERPASSH